MSADRRSKAALPAAWKETLLTGARFSSTNPGAQFFVRVHAVLDE